MNTSFSFCNDANASFFIKSFWQTEGSPSYQLECILPKGEIEVIFSFGDTLNFVRQGIKTGSTPRCFVNGLSTIPINLTAPAHQHYFGVILHPFAVKKLLFLSPGVFLNAITDLELIDKSYTALWHRLGECENFNERIYQVQQWVVGKLCTVHQQEAALSSILSDLKEVNSVVDLASYICYSTRQLHRKVQDLFGMSSEVLLRYKRYKAALSNIHHTKETLTRIAYHCGYFDQAHFNREFKEFTGITPGVYRRQQSHIPGHLYK